MRPLRRTEYETRVEIMPLIDVIFLLLTFFIYAMVLMIRAELLPMKLQAYAAGEPATPAPAAAISIMLDGSIRFDRDLIEMGEVIERINAKKREDPDTIIYLALEDGDGSVDRAPILTALWDQLKNEDLEINFVGRPTQ